MIELPSREEFRKKYIKFSDMYLDVIKKKYKLIPSNIAIKKQHGLSMMEAVEDITAKSDMFNESYYLSSALEGCAHDIGRFPQFYLSGTLNDKLSSKYIKFEDHGNYSRELLTRDDSNLLRYFLPKKTNYDHVFVEVIGEHTNIRKDEYIYDINELKNEFRNYDFSEVVNSNNEKKINKLISLKLQILREADSIELLNNVMNGLFTPHMDIGKENEINKIIYEDFKNFKYLDMAKYKENKIWTNNCGFLLRYGLLTNVVNFVATLKRFKEMDGFNRTWEKNIDAIKKNSQLTIFNIDPLMLEAQQYIKVAVDNLINCSEDGILITNESREQAKILTLKQMK